MTSSPSPTLTLEASLSPVWRVEPKLAAPAAPTAKQGPAAEAAAALIAEAQAESDMAMTPGKLRIEVDAEAGRFVHILQDAATQEVKWRYPSESQLAYSRAVRAYLKAVTGG